MRALAYLLFFLPLGSIAQEENATSEMQYAEGVGRDYCGDYSADFFKKRESQELGDLWKKFDLHTKEPSLKMATSYLQQFLTNSQLQRRSICNGIKAQVDQNAAEIQKTGIAGQGCIAFTEAANTMEKFGNSTEQKVQSIKRELAKFQDTDYNGWDIDRKAIVDLRSKNQTSIMKIEALANETNQVWSTAIPGLLMRAFKNGLNFSVKDLQASIALLKDRKKVLEGLRTRCDDANAAALAAAKLQKPNPKKR